MSVVLEAGLLFPACTTAWINNTKKLLFCMIYAGFVFCVRSCESYGATATLSLNMTLSAKTSFHFKELLYLSAPKTIVSQTSITWIKSKTPQVQVQVQVELYCHSATCGDIQWNEMSCLTGPRCYINTDIQHYKPIHKLTYWQILTKYTIYKCLPYTNKDKKYKLYKLYEYFT